MWHFKQFLFLEAQQKDQPLRTSSFCLHQTVLKLFPGLRHHHAAWRPGVGWRGARRRRGALPAPVARPQAVVPSGDPGVRSALVRLLVVPERSGSGPPEHPVRLLHRRQEQEDPAETGESDGLITGVWFWSSTGSRLLYTGGTATLLHFSQW